MTPLPLSIIILAAGKGTRMKSDKAKVLHELFYAPMVHHVLNSVLPLQPAQTVVIVGHQQAAVTEALSSFDVSFVVQKEQLGTGHAVLIAENAISENAASVMILCGDTPLIQTATLQAMYSAHLRSKATLTLMTTVLDNPTNYGRILCDSSNRVRGIVEQKDANPEQLEICEINAGIYCVDKKWLFSALQGVGTDNSQGEVYLTDIVKLAVDNGLPVEKYPVANPMDVLGVNSRVELADAQNELQIRRNRALMLQGVTMHNPATISVSPDSSLDKDTILGPGVTLFEGCRIGHSCTIGQGVILKNCHIGDNAIIGPYSFLVDCTVAPNATLPPYSQNN